MTKNGTIPHSLPFFTRSLTAFLSSPDPFRILATATTTTTPHLPVSSRAPPRNGIQTLIVLDSSFNPPTRAHAQMALSAMRTAGSGARLLLLLAVHNADKKGFAPSALASRLGMMEAFARQLLQQQQQQEEERGEGSTEQEGGGGESLGEVDVAVTKMPFFGDKARSIAEMGGYAGLGGEDPEQVYLCGFDTLVRIFDDKYYGGGVSVEELAEGTPMQRALRPFFAMAKLRVTMRPDDGWGSAEEQRAYVDGLGRGDLERRGGDSCWARRVELVEGIGEVVSSSRVREVVRRGGGDELDGLVGGEVRRWIEEEGLYRE
ncbi:hypothetical protein E4U13_000896 [Claviceps humidiphila]|uniref:Nicotinamide-nucleotide adenylyltransferase n=1 Tax=Claviceps humidiphila TaxID=1294629 RepID=A0A9P7Q9I3_9HYPO|nr:hypothetical protein E4U13_000896 [Claviceps humidiphila]